MSALVTIADATITAPGGRPLFEALHLQLGREHVALIGRNGVGKSTLLAFLAEEDDARLTVRGERRFVPQILPRHALHQSGGERRRAALEEALGSGAEVLLLDEPTEDLDDDAVAWLREALARWVGCLVVASHDRRLLGDFRHFLVASESGCRYLGGSLADVEVALERDHAGAQARYTRNLRHLAEREARTAHIAARKARKKRYGRCSEIDRATSKPRLNQKREQAQFSHGRIALVRDARLDAVRQWSKSTRRAIDVRMPLALTAPLLPPPSTDVLVMNAVSAFVPDGRMASASRVPGVSRAPGASRANRCLFAALDLTIRRERVGVVGPNGAGKTTLLAIARGDRAPSSGTAVRDAVRIGAIAQGGTDWMRDEPLVELLASGARSDASRDDAAALLVAHRFPLGLAERPLASLSPGERARAALIALFRRSPSLELLVLDEPTYSLDLVGQRAVTEALAAWPGGLLVASHDRAFLDAIGIERTIRLTG